MPPGAMPTNARFRCQHPGRETIVRFDGSGDRLEVGDVRTTIGEFEFFMVAQGPQTGSGNWRKVGTWNGSGQPTMLPTGIGPVPTPVQVHPPYLPQVF